jgi:hypothetical protein
MEKDSKRSTASAASAIACFPDTDLSLLNSELGQLSKKLWLRIELAPSLSAMAPVRLGAADNVPTALLRLQQFTDRKQVDVPLNRPASFDGFGP